MVLLKATIFEKKSDRRSQFYSEYKLLDTYPLALYLFKKLHFVLNKAIQDNVLYAPHYNPLLTTKNVTVHK